MVSTQLPATPVISVWGNNNRRFTGQKLTLFCKVSNLAGYTYNVNWINGFTITDGTRVIFSDGGRIQVARWLTGVDEEVYVLTVSDITLEYRGDIKCQVVYIAESKESKTRTYRVRVNTSAGQVLPMCSTGNTGETGYTEIEADMNVLLSCSADTVHEDATITWAMTDVYRNRSVFESNAKFGEADLRSNLYLTIDRSYDGAMFICTFSPEGDGNSRDSRDCTIGPIRVPVLTTTDRIAPTVISSASPSFTSTSRETITSDPSVITSSSVTRQRTMGTMDTQTRTPVHYVSVVTGEFHSSQNAVTGTRTSVTTITDGTITDLTRATDQIPTSTTDTITTSTTATITDATVTDLTGATDKLPTFTTDTMTTSPTDLAMATTTRNSYTISNSEKSSPTAIISNSPKSTLMSSLSTQDNDHNMNSSAMTTTSKTSPHSVSHAQSTLTVAFTQLSTKQSSQITPLSAPMTTPKSSQIITNQPSITKATPPPPSGNDQSMTLTPTPERTALIDFTNHQTKDISPMLEGKENGAQKVSFLNPSTVRATLLSCVAFLVLLFVIVMCASFCISPINRSATGKNSLGSSFYLVSLDNKSSLNSSVQTSKTFSSDVSSDISRSKTKLAQPYHVTNLMVKNARNDHHDVIYDNRCLQNVNHDRIDNRRSNAAEVIYDNRMPRVSADEVYDVQGSRIQGTPEVVYDNRTSNLPDQKRRRRNDNMLSDVIYDNRNVNITHVENHGVEDETAFDVGTDDNEVVFYSEDDEFSSQYSTDDSTYAMDSNRDFSGVVYDNRVQPTNAVLSSDHRFDANVVYDNRLGATNISMDDSQQDSNTYSSEDYAEIKPLCDGAKGDDETVELDVGIYNDSAICVAVEEQIHDLFHVNHALDNPLYNLDS